MTRIYILIACYILILVIPLYTTIKLHTTYNSCSKKNSKRGLTGFDVARKILDSNGLTSIYIVETNGKMTDAYDSNRKVLRLSKDVFHGTSIAAIAIAAHECGHAIQDATNYSWFRKRHAIWPIVSLGEKFSHIIFIIGLVIGILDLIYAGIALMTFGLIFEIVTLPCELDASKRALKIIDDYQFVDKDELRSAKKMLNAAAFTYIAAILTTLLQMLYYLLRFTRRD